MRFWRGGSPRRGLWRSKMFAFIPLFNSHFHSNSSWIRLLSLCYRTPTLPTLPFPFTHSCIPAFVLPLPHLPIPVQIYISQHPHSHSESCTYRYRYPFLSLQVSLSLSLFSKYVTVSLLSHWFFVHVLVLLLLYDATWIWVHVHDILRKRLWTIVSVAQCGSDLQLVHTNLPNPFAKMLLLIPGPLPTVGSPCHALRYSLVHRISALLSSSSYPRYNLDNP